VCVCVWYTYKYTRRDVVHHNYSMDRYNGSRRSKWIRFMRLPLYRSNYKVHSTKLLPSWLTPTCQAFLDSLYTKIFGATTQANTVFSVRYRHRHLCRMLYMPGLFDMALKNLGFFQPWYMQPVMAHVIFRDKDKVARYSRRFS